MDRVTRMMFGFGAGIPLCLVLLAASPLGTDFVYVMAGIPVLLFLWGVAASWSLILCVRFAAYSAWKSSARCAVLPAIVATAGFHLLSVVHCFNYFGDVLHFMVARPYYEHLIARLPRDRPRLVVFNWGGMIWASRGLVYDESDEVALPAGKQSVAWMTHPGLAELSCGGFRVQRLWSHYYLASFPC